MPSTEKRTVSLPMEHARYIDDQVALGRYASASEVVRAGLHALRERDAVIESWLRDEVAPVYDAMASDPARGLDARSAFDEVRAHHARRSKRRS